MISDRMRKLARALDLVAEKDRQELARQFALEQVRREAAVELHTICRRFVDEMNSLTGQVKLDLAPAQFAPGQFQENGANLFQINLNGRLVQFTFRATESLVSTDTFPILKPLKGHVSSFNQQMIEHDEIRDQRLFYCLERGNNRWRYQEGANGRNGFVDSDYIAALLERLT